MTHLRRALALLALSVSATAARGQDLNISDPMAIAEGDMGTAQLVFNVTLTGVPFIGRAAKLAAISVEFSTRDGSATAADGDYVPQTDTLAFTGLEGEIQPIFVSVNGDFTVEANESFFVDLTMVTGATPIDSEGEGTILNDDSTELSIADASPVTEGDAGTVNAATFTVSLSNPSALPVSVDFTTQNGTATTGDGDYTATSGTLGFIPGQQSGTISVPVNGDTKVEADETFSVTLSNPTPAEATIAPGQGQAVGTILNDDATELSIDDVVVSEGDASTVDAVFTVSLSAPSDFPVSVDFASRNGTATTADGDYRATTGTLDFAPGQLTQNLTVAVNGDGTVEGDETFFVDLSSPAGASIADGVGQGTIRGDDSTALSIDDIEVTEGDSGTVDAIFTVSLSSPSGSPVGVDFATRNGSATIADGDYTPAAGTLRFPPGQLVLEVSVAVNGDTRVEPDETFLVDLSSPSGAAIGDSQGIAVIVNDDAEPSVIRLLAASAVQEGAGGAAIRAERTGSRDGSAEVTISAANGTAEAGEDFASASARLTWADGELGSKSFELPILDDNIVEGDETARIRLTDPLGAVLGDPSALELVILDDDEPSRLEPIGDTELAARVSEEIELSVRASRQDGAPVQGATVSWQLVEGDAELLTGETSQTDPDGIAAQRVQLDEVPGQVTVRASLGPEQGASVAGRPQAEQPDDEVVFEITVQGNLDALFDAQENPDEASVADVVNQACSGNQEELEEFCVYIFGLDPPDQRTVIEELTPREAAAQGDFSLSSLQAQLRNILERLATLRGGSSGSATQGLALMIRDRSVPLAVLQAAFRPGGLTQGRFLARVDSALAGGLQGAATEEEPSGDPLELDAPSKWGFFVNGRISMGDRPATSRDEGFDFETQGLTAGVDYRLGERFVLGGALGYLTIDSDLDRGGGSLDVQGYSLSAYTSYFRKSFYADGVFTYGRNDYDVVRTISLPQPFGGASRLEARGDPSGTQLSVALSAGYDAAKGATSIGGFGRLSWIDGEVDGYSERGAGVLNLVIGKQDVESLLLEAGIEVSRAVSTSWGVLQPTLRASALHEFEDDSRLIRGRFVEDLEGNEFVLPTEQPDRDYFNLGLGITATLRRGRAAYIFYDTDLEREDLDIYTVSVGLRFEL
ncbi:MAG: Calx-beta domain-containing protein [Thermoanaerobaculia bacterium]